MFAKTRYIMVCLLCFSSLHVLAVTGQGNVTHFSRDVLLLALLCVVVLLVFTLCLLFYQIYVGRHKRHMMRHTMEVRERFLANVAQELRTPLSLIHGLGLQLEKPDAENSVPAPTAARMIVRQTDSLLSLVSDLLEISRVQSAIGEPKWKHGNIVTYVGMVMQNYQPCVDSKRQHLTFHHSLTAIEMDFVPAYIHRILSNLLENAIKYTGQYGNIDVILEVTDNSEFVLQVKDNGIGIEPDMLPRVFDTFFHGNHTVSESGVGLGLSLVKMMVAAMKGTVTVESVVNEGSIFTVRLPMRYEGKAEPLGATDMDVTPRQKPEKEEMPIDSEVFSKEPSTLESSKILIIEDNQDLAYYIGLHLKRSKLIYARGGKEGLEMALENLPDLIITDVLMPGDMDGLELCRQVKGHEQINHTPVIIISACVTEEDKIKGLQAGADAYLIKPFNSEELVIRVHKLIERQRLLKQKFAQIDNNREMPTENLSQKDRQFMNRLVDVVYRLMATGNVDIESVAKEMAVSRSQLNRRMLAITNQNSSTYIMQLRLSRAKRLLKADVNMPIGDVAQKCGFDDVAYFSRIFKQVFDMTPSQYRKQI